MRTQLAGSRRCFAWTAAIVLIALLVPVCAEAQGRQARGAKHDRTQWWEKGTTVQELKLSADQLATLESLYGDTDEEVRQARVDLRKSYRQLVSAMSEAALDGEAVAEARATFEAAQLHLQKLQLDRLFRLRRVLTAEQWQDLPSTAPRALRIGVSLSIRAHNRLHISKSGEVSKVEE